MINVAVQKEDDMNNLTRQPRCLRISYVWLLALVWTLSAPMLNLLTAEAAKDKYWPNKPVTTVSNPVDCVVTKHVGGKEKEVGYAQLTFTANGVSGNFSAELEQEFGKMSIKGSFSNVKFGDLISNLNEIEYLPENEGKTWHVENPKGLYTGRKFNGLGQYNSTFSFLPDKDGKTRESEHNKGHCMISGELDHGVWHGSFRIFEKSPRFSRMLWWEATTRIVQPKTEEPPKPKPKEEKCKIEEELRTLREKTGHVSSLQAFSKNMLSEVATYQPEIERIRKELDDLRNGPFFDRAIRPNPYSFLPHDPEIGRQFSEMTQRHKVLCKKQDDVITTIDNSYSAELVNLGTLIGQLQCPDVKRAMGALKKGLEDQRDLIYIQTYFSTGQREKFQAIAKEYLSRKRFVYQTHWMLAQDYLHHREMGAGLYELRATRKAFQETLKKQKGKQAPADLLRAGVRIEDMIQRTEIGFLIAVDKKVRGEAAIVRSVLWNELDRGELTFWNAITAGVPTWLAGFGRWEEGESGVESRADSYGVIAMDAALQHAGLMAILRLRVRGLTLEQIKGLNNEALIREVHKRFKKHKLSPKRAKRLRALIYQGFRNPDIERLMRHSRDDFDLYAGRPYYSPEEFQQTWYEVGGDFVLNPLMIFAMFAPYAKLTTESGHLLLLPKYMSAAEAASCKTFVQWGAGALRLPEMFRMATASNTMVARRIQAAMRFYEQSSFMTRILTESMIQTGAVHLAGAVGGLPGYVVAEVLTMLGTGDVDLAFDALTNAGVSGSAARRLAASLKEILEESIDLRNQAKIVSRQSTIKRMLSILDAGGNLDDSMRNMLKQGAQELENLLKQMDNAGNSELVRMQALQIDLAARAQRMLAKGDVARARFLVQTLDDADGFITGVTKKLQDGVKVAEKAADVAAVGTKDLVETVKIRFPAEASVEELGQRMTSTDRGCHRAVQLWGQLTGVRTFKAADEAMRKGDLDAAVSVYRNRLTALNTKLEAAVAAGNPHAVKNHMDEMLLYLESYTIARDVRDAARRLVPFGNVAGDTFMAAIDVPNARKVGGAISEAFEEVSKGGKQLDEVLPPLKTSAGEATKDAPRLVKVGNETFMFREIIRSGGEAVDAVTARKSEVFAYRLAKKLEINSPACAEVTWKGADGEIRRGIIQRMVSNVSDLSAVDRGTALAVKKHVAQDKVLSLILGDPDRHARNFLVTVDGKVYSIDHGQAAIIETLVGDWSKKTPKEIKDTVELYMQQRYRMYLARLDQWHIMNAIEKRIDPSDMAEMLEKVGKLTREDIEGLLEGLYPKNSAEFKQAADTIMLRIEYVGELLANPPKLGFLQPRHYLSERQYTTPSGVTGDTIKEVNEEYNAGMVGRAHIKRKTIPRVCYIKESLRLAA